MEDDMEGRIEIVLDASRITKRMGDEVVKGEDLGTLDNEEVLAPFPGVVEMIAFNPSLHTFLITLCKKAE